MTLQPYYRDEHTTIYHGEALEVLRELEPGTVDVILTDPPYSSGGMYRSTVNAAPSEKYRGWSQSADGSSRKPTAEYGSFAGDNRDQRAWTEWVYLWSYYTLRATKPGASSFQFTDWRQLPASTQAVQLGGWTWRGLLVWDKGVARPIRGQFRNHLEYVVWSSHGGLPDQEEAVYPSALIQVPTVGVADREHVTQKPVDLLRALLSVVGGHQLTALDPFMGSGSTLVAARQMGHQCIGIELDERYCEIAARRLSEHQTALFDNAMPIVEELPEPFDLGDWDEEEVPA